MLLLHPILWTLTCLRSIVRKWTCKMSCHWHATNWNQPLPFLCIGHQQKKPYFQQFVISSIVWKHPKKPTRKIFIAYNLKMVVLFFTLFFVHYMFWGAMLSMNYIWNVAIKKQVSKTHVTNVGHTNKTLKTLFFIN